MARPWLLRGWRLGIVLVGSRDRGPLPAARAGSGDPHHREPGGRRRSTIRGVRRVAGRRPRRARRRLHGPSQWRRSVSADAGGDSAGASSASASRASSTRTARSAISSPQALSAAAERGVDRAHRPRRLRRRRCREPSQDRLDAGRRRRSCGSTRCARGHSRRRTTARIARCWSSTATSRSPAAIGLADHWLGHAAESRALARHAVQGDRPGGARARSVVLRELARGRRPLGAGPRSRAAAASAPARDRSSSGAIPTGGASNVKLLYLLSIAGARQRIDIQSPYFVLDESTPMVARRSAQARRARPHPHRRRRHRREAGEGREPRRVSAAARRRLRDLRVPADDDAREGDDGRRRLERRSARRTSTIDRSS